MSTMIRGVEGVKKVSEMLGDYQRSLLDYQCVSESGDEPFMCSQNVSAQMFGITRDEIMSVFQARIKDNAIKLENIGIKVADAYSEGK